MSERVNKTCGACMAKRNCLNGAWCEVKGRYVEHEARPICGAPLNVNNFEPKVVEDRR